MPTRIKKLYKQNKICSADYSDYIRVKLLEKYYGIYFDATTLFTDKIPKDVFYRQYWSVKGDYQKNTNPVAMLHFHFGQVYALGGMDNTIYSYVRQLLDAYYKEHEYCFSYYMIYYFFEYLYLIKEHIRFVIDVLPNNNEDCEQLAYALNNIDIDNFNYKNTFFYKLRSSDEYTQEHYKIFDKLLNK